ncbi:bifunctional glutamate--cysteine ligase GshA/glutathione synthetase GshB [Loigolactobacillus coryniformis]|uniref:glutamate--cysteine ligase n=1 Tax=Loigolactobacillus coryniformis TaxID=1610 RepID=A0A5B8TQA9_9LACO|nr:bifunctional glutamate--cysteine ligase GshA/glutathione synthetase GshB [Loigolactobacillus coryniformis]QEA54074.1 bifunctional glutamate--cysteine ligase GshA/glutathione synthetase GshB [Loigolactobacillus coryniformis]
MLDQIGTQLKKYQHEAFLFAGHYGIEKESQRVNTQGDLSQTPLPFTQPHPYVKNDFAQAQAEVATDYFDTCQQTFQQLQGLDAVLLRALPENEVLWPLSMPPALPSAAEIKIAAPTAAGLHYRQQIAHKYGYQMQMMSAVHVNFSLSERLMRFLFEVHYHNQFNDDYIAFHNAAYLKLTQNYLRYRYVLIYLFGASPLAAANFSTAVPDHLVRSLHASRRLGYVNRASQEVSFQSITAYVADLQQLINNGELQGPREFYSPVRLHGNSLAELESAGIHYLELRNLDIDPYAADGLSATTLNFFRLFLAYLLVTPSVPVEQAPTVLVQAAAQNETVALESPLGVSRLQPQLQEFMQSLGKFAQNFQAPVELQQALQTMQARVVDYRLTPSYRLSEEINGGSLQQFALRQAQIFKQQAIAQPYQLPGYTQLAADSQLLLANAYQRGLAVRLLDEQAGVFQLAEHEVIGPGASTRLNSQTAVMASQNKLVTKKLLGQAGLIVPAGAEYTQVATAMADFADLAKQGLVVKPKRETKGQGITVFQTAPTAELFKVALERALTTGTSALVENYVPGTVYRFLVIAGRVCAVAECMPANVVGDGRQALTALVVRKNKQANRGLNRPFRPLPLDGQTDFDLQQQGLQRSIIPARGNQVNLRLAATFATGADAVDVTADMDASYKEVAVAAAQALQLQVAGVDIVIDNLYQPVDAAHPELATVLSVTARPELAVHEAPYFGTAQPVTAALLDQLLTK